MGERPTTSIGLITTGTVLAVGVSAAYIAIAVGLQGNVHLKPDPLFMFLAAAGAIASLIAYAFTMVFGLAYLNQKTEAGRTRELNLVIISLFFQAFSAAIFGVVAIITLRPEPIDRLSRLERKVPHDRDVPAIIRNPVHHPHLRRRHGDTSLEAGPGRNRKPASGHLRT